MSRFLILSGLLWVSLLLWSSFASASYVCPAGYTSDFQFESEAQAACDAFTASMSWSSKTYECRPYTWTNGRLSISAYADGTRLGTNTYTYCDATPSCDAPDYIDATTGECVTPDEFCYTELESMSDECILLGPGDSDPNDEIPPGCVEDSTGKQVCLTEDPNCYTINGVQACATPDSVCGWKNGTWNCVAPEEEGCGYFNGERVCFTPDGDQVPTDSPDHPDNGGNLDGNENNDPTDPRPPGEGGDESNQPGESPPTTDDGRASEKTARDQLNELRDIDNKLGNLPGQIGDQVSDGLTEENGKGSGEYGSEVGSAGDQAITDSGVDELIDGIEGNPMDGSAGKTALEGIGDSVSDIIPQGACTPLGMAVGPLAWEITCADAARIRDVLGYILYALTAIFIFTTITNTKGRH